MNKVILTGNLVRDPELKYVPGTGNAVAKFTLAVARGFGEKKETDFINCVSFGKSAENIAQFTVKGSKVAVEGSIKTGSYTNKEGNKVYTTDIYCNNVEFLSKPEQSNGYAKKSNDGIDNAFGTADEIGVFLEPIDEGDLPFN